MVYKVAVATSDGINVDSHFGHVLSFVIYDVDEETGEYDDVEERDVAAACSGGNCGSIQVVQPGCGGQNGSSSCGGSGAPDTPMEKIAEALSDVDYVLCAKIGPHAIRALAKYNVSAYDIVLPVGQAIKKINDFRLKIKARKQNLNTGV